MTVETDIAAIDDDGDNLASELRTALTSIYAEVPNDADNPPASADDMDDEFNGSSLDPKWTPSTITGATTTVTDGALLFKPSSGLDEFQGVAQTIAAPTSAWIFRAKAFGSIYQDDAPNVRGATLYVQLTDADGVLKGVGAGRAQINVISGAANGGACTNEAVLIWYFGNAAYIEAEWNGTTVVFRASDSGFDGSWIDVGTWTPGATPVRVGLGTPTKGLSALENEVNVFYWFRRIA